MYFDKDKKLPYVFSQTPQQADPVQVILWPILSDGAQTAFERNATREDFQTLVGSCEDQSPSNEF